LHSGTQLDHILYVRDAVVAAFGIQSDHILYVRDAVVAAFGIQSDHILYVRDAVVAAFGIQSDHTIKGAGPKTGSLLVVFASCYCNSSYAAALSAPALASRRHTA